MIPTYRRVNSSVECFPDNYTTEQSQNLLKLKKMLLANRHTQEKLKKIRNELHCRMATIDEFITTYRLNVEHPPSASILSYIKFQRNIPLSFKQQIRIADIGTFNRSILHDENCQFISKLNKKKNGKNQLNIKQLPQDCRSINFVKLAKQFQAKAGIQIYKEWYDHYRIKQPKRLFSLAEDKLILEKQVIYRNCWEKICQYIQNQNFDAVYYEYHNRLNPILVTGRWNTLHTLMLIVLLEHYGPKKWSTIAAKMKVKSQLQVRERYCSLIDPNIGKDYWTTEMEHALLQMAQDYNYCWKKISVAPIFKNKTDNCIWRKWKLLMIRFSQEEIREMLPPTPMYRNLGEKILKQKVIFQSKKRASFNKPQPPIYFGRFKERVRQPSNLQAKRSQKGTEPSHTDSKGIFQGSRQKMSEIGSYVQSSRIENSFGKDSNHLREQHEIDSQ